ncbi:MAG: molybdate ABC transporter substrate-binding protein [Acidobacteriota bacterium]
MELSVFAASSLTEAFRQLEEGFEAAHPDIDVRLTFSGSQVLRLQLEQGAVADVFASANERHMDALVDAGMVSYSRVFAHNELVVVVPPDNPASVDSFPELPRAERLVIGTEGVPVGIYTRQLLDRAGAELGEEFVARLRDSVVSEEANVRLVRAKVELGEADAAIVYRTDATVSDRVKVVAVPESLNVRASYFIGPITASGNPAADRFIAYVLSEEGRRALEDHGFVTGAS